MRYTTLDNTVNSLLFQKSLSIHWYAQFLKYSSDCLRELTLDTLQVVNTVELIVNPNDFTAPLPCDYVDYTKIGLQIGQFVRPIPELEGINRLPATLANGQNTTYGTPNNVYDGDMFGLIAGAFWFANIDDLGENIGRLFGWPAAPRTNGFKIIPERGIIQMTETYCQATVYLEYIGDGQCIDNASQVLVYAQKTIEAYMDWQMKLHTGRRSLNEIGMAYKIYIGEWRKLRARVSGLTISDIKQAVWRNYKQSMKS